MPAGERFAYIEGLNQARRLLRPPANELVGEPWRNAMTDLAESGASAGQAGAPYRTGLLKSKIYARVQKGVFPRWAAVRARGKRRSKGTRKMYDYGRVLEYSAKHGHAGWFNRAVWGPLIGQAEAALSRAGSEIQRKWGR